MRAIKTERFCVERENRHKIVPRGRPPLFRKPLLRQFPSSTRPSGNWPSSIPKKPSKRSSNQPNEPQKHGKPAQLKVGGGLRDPSFMYRGLRKFSEPLY